MLITINYILEHPDEFDKDSKVLILSKETLDKIDDISFDTTTKPKRKKNNNPLMQFEIYGPWEDKLRQHIPWKDYEALKKITKLTKEGVNISYWIDMMWFVTTSQRTLDKVNKYFETDLRFDMEHRTDTAKYLTGKNKIVKTC